MTDNDQNGEAVFQSQGDTDSDLGSAEMDGLTEQEADAEAAFQAAEEAAAASDVTDADLAAEAETEAAAVEVPAGASEFGGKVYYPQSAPEPKAEDGEGAE